MAKFPFQRQAMTDLLGDVVEGLGKLAAEEAGKILTQENVSHLARQFFTNSNISVNFLASAVGAAILLGLFLLYLLLVNPLGFWGAMMDEMVGYMGSGGERKMCMIELLIYQLVNNGNGYIFSS